MPCEPFTIVLVDDEDDVRKLVGETLRMRGYKVVAFAEGAHAFLAAQQGQLDRVDLLIADVMMPEMDGRLLAQHLQELQPGMRVLFMSGYTRENVPGHFGRIAEESFLQKPFALAELFGKVRQALLDRAVCANAW